MLEYARAKTPGGTASGECTGVLLLNLGTPDGTGYWAMRRYLAEFLSDPRVIELPRWQWLPILHLFVLSTRPFRKGRDYERIWNWERNESPLKTIARAQAEELQGLLAREFTHKEVSVEWAMRYGNPSTESRIRALAARGCTRLLLVPLYPQYAAATTATACDAAFQTLMTLRRQPAVRTAPPWYDDPVYIEALAASAQGHLARLDFEPEAFIASFHGMPQRYAAAGDPYPAQCLATSHLLREALSWPEERWFTTFQSRFGREPWLEPSTLETVERLAAEGVRRLVVAAPGFVADCLETLEELDQENRRAFLAKGGGKFAYLPALNATPHGMRVIAHIVRRELSGWL